MRLALHRHDSGRRVKKEGIIHGGGRVATTEARLKDASDGLCGHATATCVIFREDS